MLLAAFAAPLLLRRRSTEERPATLLSGAELALALGASAALWLFSSAYWFALLQWNTGVRYLVPAAPLLFAVLVPVLLRAGPLVRYLLVAPTIAVSWSVAMAREDVPTSLIHIFVGGFELPFLTVLRKTASGYAPWLEATGVSPLPIFALVGITLWLLWRDHRTGTQRLTDGLAQHSSVPNDGAA